MPGFEAKDMAAVHPAGGSRARGWLDEGTIEFSSGEPEVSATGGDF
jgi:hypothetical protein